MLLLSASLRRSRRGISKCLSFLGLFCQSSQYFMHNRVVYDRPYPERVLLAGIPRKSEIVIRYTNFLALQPGEDYNTVSIIVLLRLSERLDTVPLQERQN